LNLNWLAKETELTALSEAERHLRLGASPPAGKTWKSIFLNEVRDRIDSKRVHFTGRLAYGDYLKALQVSSAHVYLTYPFVLSWSCIEALSCGCVVIGSDTTPVRDVINGENGVLVPFFDHEQLANRAIEVLAQPRRFQSMRAAARRTAVEQFDLQTISLPQTMALLREGETPQGPKASEITPDSEARIAARKQRPSRRIGRSNLTAAALSRRRC
jgi:glycosyltransferase involved in cell wall biosynthesis